MKKFNLKKMIAYVLVAMMTFGVFSMNASAAEIVVDMDDYRAALQAAIEAGIQFDDDTQAELIDIVKDAADSLDIVEEGADPAKSTFVSFAENPVKIVEYDGEAQSLRGVAVKTVGYDYVADTENLYIGILEDGTPYQSFEEPTEVGFYYVVCMYAGDDNNYPSVGYGILVILPAEEETTEPSEDPTETTEPSEDPTEPSEDPTETTEPSEDPTEATKAPETPTDATTAEKEAPKTGDTTQIMTYVAAMVVALGAMAVILFRKKNA